MQWPPCEMFARCLWASCTAGVTSSLPEQPTRAGPPDQAHKSSSSLAQDRNSIRHSMDRCLSKLPGPCMCCNMLCTLLAGCLCCEQQVPRRALTDWHAEGATSDLTPGSRRAPVEHSSDDAQGAPRGAETSPSRLSAQSRRGTVEPGENIAQRSRRDTAEPGVGGVQPHVPDVDVSPSRLGSGSRRATAERGRVSCLCRAGI